MIPDTDTQRSAIHPVALWAVAIGCGAMLVIGVPSTAHAQEGEQRAIELDTIEIESEVPRRIAQFFVQRDQLRYQEIDDQPTFMPELLETVEEEPF